MVMGCSSSQVNDVEPLIVSDSRATNADVNASPREVVLSALSKQSCDDHKNGKSTTQQQIVKTAVCTTVDEVENKGKEKEKLKSQLGNRVLAITKNSYRPKGQSDEFKRCVKALEDAVKRLQAKRLQKLLSLQQEKLSYLNRLSEIASVRLRHNNPDIADLSDENRATKLAEKLSELYDNEWTDVFEMTKKRTGNKSPDKDIAISLRNILEYCYDECRELSEIQRQKILMTLCLPGEKKNIEASPDVRFMLKTLQKDAADYSVMYVQKVISTRSFNDKQLKNEVIVRAVGKEKRYGLYVNSCIKIAWHTQIHDPPLVLDFKGGDNPTALFRPYTSSGTILDYVLWPVMLLHKGGPIVAKGVAQFSKPPEKEIEVKSEYVTTPNISDEISKLQTV